MARWGRPGGILGLLDLIEERRAQLEYDWRTRFALPLTVVGSDAMTYGEAWRLVGILAGDPTSQLSASAAGWDHPWSHEAALLADLWDLTVAANTSGKSRREPYPRPWPTTGTATRTRGDAGGRSPDEVRAILASMREGVTDGR